jgi:hypothetical protein
MIVRAETDIPGLYLAGQDVFSCGFIGALFSGAITAQVTISFSPLYLNAQDKYI